VRPYLENTQHKNGLEEYRACLASEALSLSRFLLLPKTNKQTNQNPKSSTFLIINLLSLTVNAATFQKGTLKSFYYWII
jgi:hypothetical protein